MTPHGTRMRRVKKLALAGALIATAATFALLGVGVSTGWMWVAAGCTQALALLVVIADVAERSAAVGDGAAPSRAGTRMRRVKNLARVGMWIASAAVFALLSVSTGWQQVAAWSATALAVLSVVAEVAERIAVVAGLEAGGRRGGWRGKGSGLGWRGRDDDGPAGEAVHRWRALAVVSRLMPASAGRRWLAEAQSLLAEVTAARRGGPQLPAVGAPAGGDDVGTRDPAACAPWPAPPGVRDDLRPWGIPRRHGPRRASPAPQNLWLRKPAGSRPGTTRPELVIGLIFAR